MSYRQRRRTRSWSGSCAPDGRVGALCLIDAAVGTRIDVVTADGSHVSYEIAERRSYAKDQGLPRTLFRAGGAPRLVLITYGGTFDRNTQHYTDNVVILAT